MKWNDLVENQVQFFMGYIIGGSTPSAFYTLKKNKITLCLDTILRTAQFKGVSFTRKLCESIAHEYFHAHVKTEFGDVFFKAEERMCKLFTLELESPPPFMHKPDKKCKSCGKETFYSKCEKCSIDELLEKEW